MAIKPVICTLFVLLMLPACAVVPSLSAPREALTLTAPADPTAAQAADTGPARTATGFYWPTGKEVSRPYNWLANNCGWAGFLPYLASQYHVGVDIAAQVGDPVYAIADGTVRALTRGQAAGWWGDTNGHDNVGVVVEHRLTDGTPFIAVYGHVVLSGPDPTSVIAGRPFATVGPYNDQPHLHFGIRTGTRIDGPLGALDCPAAPRPTPVPIHGTSGFVDPIDWITTQTPAAGSSTPIATPVATIAATRTPPAPVPTPTPRPTPTATAVPIVVPNTLRAVVMAAPSNGWIVGQGGALLHWDGRNWNLSTSPTSRDLYALAALSPADVWAVGAIGTTLHWNGTAWAVAPDLGTNNLFSLAMTSATEGWAVGDGDFVQITGGLGHWLPIQEWLFGISMVSPDDGWAVGKVGGATRSGGRLYHWGGNGWRIFNAPLADVLYSVAMRTSSDGWAVGVGPASNGAAILHWDGTAWVGVDSPSPTWLLSVAAVTATDAWAVGYMGTILHWDGSTWQVVPSPTKANLWSMSMAASTDGWAVGDNGTILHWDGQSWSPMSISAGSPASPTPASDPTVAAEPTAVGLDRQTIASIVAYFNQAIQSRSFAPIADLMGPDGIAYGTFGSEIVHHRGDNRAAVLSNMQQAMTGANLSCLGFDMQLGGMPDKAQFFLQGEGVDWPALSLKSSGPATIAFGFERPQTDWVLRWIAAVPQALIPPTGSLRACPGL